MRCHAGGIRRALLAWVAVAAVLFASASPLVAGHLAIDQDCAPAPAEAHDHAAHRLSQAPDPEPDHCVACHLTRAARDASHADAVLPLGLARTAALQLPNGARYRADLRTDFTRGPPSDQI